MYLVYGHVMRFDKSRVDLTSRILVCLISNDIIEKNENENEPQRSRRKICAGIQ